MTLTKKTKFWGIAAATLTMTGALVAPQAVAGSKAELGNSKVQALESQVNEMADMLRSMQAELDAVRRDAKQPVAPAPVVAKSKDNMVFFRGGFASMDHKRNGVSITSEVAPVGAQDQADKDAWYMGAGFDFSLSEDAWGLSDSTEVLAELMFEYKEFASNVQGNALANNPTQLAGGALNPRSVTVNQLSLSASPKIKFMKGSDFRPWIIPAGFAMHIISPPSESITVLNPGIMFGAGADYRIWKDIYVGVDGRYHLTSAAADGVNTDGFTAGGY